jgi:cytochrome c
LRDIRRRIGLLASLWLAGLLVCFFPSQAQDLRGHGGPVRTITISADGQTIVTGSFDESVIRWNAATGSALAVLRGHEGSVNAAVILGRRLATAGQDGRILLWGEDGTRQAALEGHGAPVVSLALSPDGRTIASASWDQTVRLWPLSGGAPRVLEGHTGNVNAVAFAPDGRAISAGYDGTLRIWPESGAPLVASFAIPFSALARQPPNLIRVESLWLL